MAPIKSLSCWTNRSRLEKWLILAGVVILVLFLIVVGVYQLLIRKSDICTAPGCVRSAAEILDNIDVIADPCDDFYNFACGKFLAQTNLEYQQTVSAESAIANTIQMQMKQLLERPPRPDDASYFIAAKRFYRACMNDTARERRGLTRIKQIFKEMGGWPILESYWNAADFDWKRATHKLRRVGINFDLFLKLSVEKHNASNILVINGPSFSQSDIESIPLDYMVELAVEFGAEKNRATREQKEVVLLLINIAKILEAIGQEKKHERMTIGQLQEIIPAIEWLSYINGVVDSGIHLASSDYIVVAQTEYVDRIIDLLRRTNKRVTANFMCWYTLQYVIHHLPNKILDKVYHYAQKLHHNVPKFEKWQTCLSSTHTRFSLALSAVFVDYSYDQESRDKVLEITRDLKAQFKIATDNLDWLDDRSKAATKAKISSSSEAVVSANDLRDALSLENLYNEIEIDEDKYLETVLRVDLLNTNLKYGKLKQTVRNAPWSCRRFPTGFDIDYSPQENTFRIPAGLLQGLYFRKDRPNYMNYGSLGSAVAHEISHIFTIAEYRSQGDLRDYWSPQSILKYVRNVECLSKQYATFYVPETGRHLNSSITQDEDAADLGGMKIAYEAYLRWIERNNEEPLLPGLSYTPRQLFWISAAIRQCAKHTPYALEKFTREYTKSLERFRVNGPLRNLKYFSYDFGCSKGSYMNPEQKCHIW